MLLHESFAQLRIFRETSFFYTTGDMVRKIRFLAENMTALEDMRKKIMNCEGFRFELQMRRYLDLLMR